jgi:hypothetical protein
MIGCVENNHDHEGPRATCVRATRTPTTSHSVTGQPTRHRRTPTKFEDPFYDQQAADSASHTLDGNKNFDVNPIWYLQNCRQLCL